MKNAEWRSLATPAGRNFLLERYSKIVIHLPRQKISRAFGSTGAQYFRTERRVRRVPLKINLPG